MKQNNKETIEANDSCSKNDHEQGRRRLLSGVAGASALAVWHKPIVNSVILPAHAQASVVGVCPTVTVENVLFGPLSGVTVPPVCSVTFDVFSSDPTEDVTIMSIDTSTLAANVTVDVQALGTATSSSGPRVVWQGPASDAPFCSDLMPTNDVTFTVTLTCSSVPPGTTFTQSFTLLSIL